MKTLSFILFICLLVPTLVFGQVETSRDSLAKPNDTIPALSDTLALANDTLALANDTIENQLNQPIYYQSNDSIYFSLRNKKAYLYKGAQLKSGSMTLDADFIHINMDVSVISASGMADSLENVLGKPIFEDQGQKFEADTIKYNMKTRQGLVKNVISEQSGGYLHGNTTKMHKNKHIHVIDGKYTTCNAEHPHFYINLTKAKVIPDDKIISGPLNFVILDIPTPIGLPFGWFPNKIERKSGILFPKYGDDREKGFFLRDGGYYLPINDYIDLAMVGSIYSRGSWDAKITSKYALRYKFSGNINLHYARNVLGEKGFDGYVDKRSYSIQVRHAQDSKANPYSRFNASIKYEGGLHRQLNSTNYNDYLNTTNTSSLSYSFTPNQNWNFMLSANANQNTRDNKVNITAPNFNLNVNRRYLVNNEKAGKRKWYEKIQYSYKAQAQASFSGVDSTLFSDATRVKAGFKHSIPVSASYNFWKYFSFSPSVDYTGVLYPYSIEKKWYAKLTEGGSVKKGVTVTDTIPEMKYAHSVNPRASLSFTPQIYGFFTFSDKAKVKAIRHLMSPSISMSISPDGRELTPGYYKTYSETTSAGEQIEREYSIFEGFLYGTPSGSAESGSVNFSLNNQFEMKVRNENVDSTATDKEKYRKVGLLDNLNFTTNYNMLKDSLKWGDIRMTGNTSLFSKKLRLTFNGGFTMYDHGSTGGKIDQFRFQNGKSPLRFTNGNISLSASLNNSFFKKEAKQKGDGEQQSKKKTGKSSLPWTMNISYSFNYTSRWNSTTKQFEPNYTQTINISGNIDFTENWNFGYRSGWDFQNKKIAPTSFNISRDLHCWQMSMNWIPFGRLQSYYFQINVKSAIFKDLKYELRETINRTNF